MNTKQQLVFTNVSQYAKKFWTNNFLRKLFEQIDLHHFDGYFTKSTRTILLRWNTRFTSLGGRWSPKENLIELSYPIFYNVNHQFKSKGTGHVETVNGIQCTNLIQALMTVVEHEMVHAYLTFTGTRERKSHGRLFMHTARCKFGHTQFYHDMSTSKKLARAEGVRRGSRVEFKGKRGRVVGRVKMIKKNATVISDIGRKYYVPVKLLKLHN